MKWPFHGDDVAADAVDRRAGRLPVDLVALVGFVLLALVVLVVWNVDSVLVRTPFAAPLLLFAPGYVVVSFVLPRRRDGDERVSSGRPARRVGTIERFSLAVGLSFAVLPFLGLVIATVGSFSPDTVVVAVAGFVFTVGSLAAVRRQRVPPTERYRLGVMDGLDRTRSALTPGDSPLLAAVNLALLISVVLALATGGFALLAPQDGEQFTDLRLLTENDSGELVAADYPDSIAPGENESITVSIENRENQEMNYTLFVQQQRVEDGSVVERDTITVEQYTVGDGERIVDEVTIEPSGSGELRFAFLLYEDGSVPELQTTENAYRSGHLWIDVGEG